MLAGLFLPVVVLRFNYFKTCWSRCFNITFSVPDTCCSGHKLRWPHDTISGGKKIQASALPVCRRYGCTAKPPGRARYLLASGKTPVFHGKFGCYMDWILPKSEYTLNSQSHRNNTPFSMVQTYCYSPKHPESVPAASRYCAAVRERIGGKKSRCAYYKNKLAS